MNLLDSHPLPSSGSPRKRRFVAAPDLKSFFIKPSEKPNQPRFLVLTCLDEGKSFKSISSCRLARSIDAVAGQLQTVTRQRDGTILLEARSNEQISKFLALQTLDGLKVSVVTHPSLNFCKGVVNHEDFMKESDADLQAFFEGEGVVDIRRIQRKVDGALVPTSTLVLTFDRPSLPERIRCGFYNLRVRQYVPNPLRCFKCQKFGHSQQRCFSTSTCATCSQPSHEGACTSPPHCINCDGSHASSSRECPKYIMEREIQKIRVTDKLSFPEARRQYQARHPVPMTHSFSAALQTKSSLPLKSMSSQTEPMKSATRSIGSQAVFGKLVVELRNLSESDKIIIPRVSSRGPTQKECATQASGHKTTRTKSHSPPAVSSKQPSSRSPPTSPSLSGSELDIDEDPDMAASQFLGKHVRKKKGKRHK